MLTWVGQLAGLRVVPAGRILGDTRPDLHLPEILGDKVWLDVPLPCCLSSVLLPSGMAVW